MKKKLPLITNNAITGKSTGDDVNRSNCLRGGGRCEYEDWVVVVGAVLQPVPLCAGALACGRVAQRLGGVLRSLARDPRCAAHGSVAPARAARPCPPSWLRATAPSDPILALPHQQLCQLWGSMVIFF